MTFSPDCFICHQPAANQDGGWYSILIDDGRIARAADVCMFCKMVHTTLVEANGMEDPKKRIKRLREQDLQGNYAVCCWYDTREDGDDILERQYVVLLDSRIVTRLDRFPDGKRTAKDVITDGWKIYEPKKKVKDVFAAVEIVSEALEAKGYRRKF